MDSDAALSRPLSQCQGVGQSVQTSLARLGLHTLTDVLFHLPLRYENRGRVVAIGELRHGQQALINAVVEHCEVIFRRKRMLLVKVSDGNDVSLRFFHFHKRQLEQLKPGTLIHCYGEAQQGRSGGLEMLHPEYGIGHIEGGQEEVRAIYPSTAGLHQASLRRLVQQALKHLHELEDWLPAHSALAALPSLPQALQQLHQPKESLSLASHPAIQRLAVEELIAHHLSLIRVQRKNAHSSAPPLAQTGTLSQQFLTRLPFELTSAQKRVIGICQHDMLRPHPMQRLLQGDVGCGKTAVAAALMALALDNGFCAALMAPTELLAEQHARQLDDWFSPLGITVITVTAQENTAIDASAGPLLLIGTHALFQTRRQLPPLGLIVIDEQHRFGVNQRLALAEKGRGTHGYPHQLIMTATPIPRSLAMTAYADLDYTVIDELPAGRKPVTTVALPNGRRQEVIQRIEHACTQGRQVYWVCTLIDESEKLQSQAAATTAELLHTCLSKLRIELVHGQLKSGPKNDIMRRFAVAEIDILVATTVIEVGVNVPNACLMIIENAERLGLAQLHQLRGRVGRGGQSSACVLMYQPPLSNMAHQRINALRTINDGFRIAQLDLQLRGPGEVLGTRQAGDIRFRVADLIRDQEWIPQTQAIARQLLETASPHIDTLIQRWFPQAETLARI